MTRLLINGLAINLLILAACTPPTSNTPEGQKVAERIHEYVMDQVTDYRLSSNTKALAACIRWPTDASTPIFVDTVGGAFVADQSDGQLAPGAIISSAMQNCQGNQARGQHDCDCQLLDVGNSNRLEVPANLPNADALIRSRRSTAGRDNPATKWKEPSGDTKK